MFCIKCLWVTSNGNSSFDRVVSWHRKSSQRRPFCQQKHLWNAHIKTTLLQTCHTLTRSRTMMTSRFTMLTILYDDDQSWNLSRFASCENFLRKQHLLLHNLRGNMNTLCDRFVKFWTCYTSNSNLTRMDPNCWFCKCVKLLARESGRVKILTNFMSDDDDVWNY